MSMSMKILRKHFCVGIFMVNNTEKMKITGVII